MKKLIFRYFKKTLFFLFVFVIIAYIFLEVFIPSKTMDIVRYRSYVVVSSSMEPDIMVNDIIIIHKVMEDDLHVDDAITFEVYITELNEMSKVTHYIGAIETVDNEVIYKTLGATKEAGDYDVWKNEDNEVVDITYDDIEGRVILVIPYLGHVVNLLRDPLMLGLLGANIVIIYMLVKAIKKSKKEK